MRCQLATRVWAGLLALAVLLPACGDGPPAPGSQAAPVKASAPATGAWEQLLAEARKEERVVTIAPPFPPLRQAYTEQFKKDTGIDLEYLGLPTNEGSARAEREAVAGKPSMDVLVGGGSEVLT